MRVRVHPDGDLLLTRIPLLLADTLYRVPELLRSDDPRVRERLLPRTYQDDDDEAHWRRYVGPDLEHLFATRAETVERDLRLLQLEGGAGGDTFRLRIPGRHRAAWQSALNAASHAIYLQAGLTPADVQRDPGELEEPERDVALYRLQLLGYMLGHILEAEGYRFPTRDEVDGWGPEA